MAVRGHPEILGVLLGSQSEKKHLSEAVRGHPEIQGALLGRSRKQAALEGSVVQTRERLEIAMRASKRQWRPGQ